MKHHEYASLFPMPSAERIREIADDIKANGQQLPIITLHGEILDGRTRDAACELIGKTPWYEAYQGNDPLAFVVSLNLKRRHLDEAQRAMVGGRIAALGEGNPTGANQHKGGTESIDSVPREKAAEMLNVGTASITRARRVLRQGAPELIKAVDDGEIAVSAAAKVSELPQDEQRQVVARGRHAATAKAKELRGEEEDEPPSKNGQTPRYRPDHARDCWNLAKVQLDRILPQDVSRVAVLKEAKAYIDARIAKNL